MCLAPEAFAAIGQDVVEESPGNEQIDYREDRDPHFVS
jgi:hypothetical protein